MVQVSAIAEELMKTEYDVVRIIFNKFQSAISFKPTIATVLSPDALEKEVEAGGKLDQYETEGPDRAEMLQDLAEFQLAVVSHSPPLNPLSYQLWVTMALCRHLAVSCSWHSIKAALCPCTHKATGPF